MIRLRSARLTGDVHEMVFLLRLCSSRNFCCISNPLLYSQALSGTKCLVEEFTEEVCLALKVVCYGKPNEETNPSSVDAGGKHEEEKTEQPVDGVTFRKVGVHRFPSRQTTDQTSDDLCTPVIRTIIRGDKEVKICDASVQTYRSWLDVSQQHLIPNWLLGAPNIGTSSRTSLGVPPIVGSSLVSESLVQSNWTNNDRRRGRQLGQSGEVDHETLIMQDDPKLIVHDEKKKKIDHRNAHKDCRTAYKDCSDSISGPRSLLDWEAENDYQLNDVFTPCNEDDVRATDRFEYLRRFTTQFRETPAVIAERSGWSNSRSGEDLKKMDDVLKFLVTLRLSFGRTALCLSGGGSLAMYHMGIIRTLIELKCLPRVISGTSGGSIVAGVVAFYTDEELVNDVSHCVSQLCVFLSQYVPFQVLFPDIVQRYGVRWFPPVSSQLQRFFLKG